MNSDFLENIKKELSLGEQDINTYSPLVLAYIGDAVYEVVIRTMLVCKQNEQVQKLHGKATRYVKAEAQKNMIEVLMDELSEDELLVYKRARNSKQHTTPKNAKLSDYHKATGFEAVIGYLFLKGEEGRMLELCSMGIQRIETDVPGKSNIID